MNSQDRAAEIGKAAFTCPHCGAYTSQAWHDLKAVEIIPAEAVGPYDPEKVSKKIVELQDAEDVVERAKALVWRDILTAVNNGDPGITRRRVNSQSADVSNLFLSKCFACSRESVWLGFNLIYPSRLIDAPAPNDDLPPNIRQDYEEAAQVAASSPRSAAALLRLSLQKLCAHVLGRDGNINAMIGELVQAGLSPVIQKALDVVRVVGNETVHPGSLDIRDNRDTVSRLFMIINMITDSLITQPKHVAELYETLPEEKLKGIEARDRKREEK